MKKTTTRLLAWLLTAVWILCQDLLIAQPDPGMNGDSTLVGGGPLSGGVPLGSGVVFFLLFGIAYGARRWWNDRKNGQ